MKSEISYPKHRSSKYLVACLAALIAASAPSLRAAASDDLQKLQDENAALRKRLAQLEGNAEATNAAAPATTAGQATAAPTAGSLGTDEGVQTLSPFQVKEDKDYGYLKTNAATATKIGMEIQKVPLNMSVLSREFLDDTNARSVTDLFRYSAASASDNRFAMRVPANEATPQGSFTMRGFQVNNLMRDGIFRYIAYNLDNIDRVEIVKGPASVFFGQGYPGGVINYITKRASFAKIPTTFTYQIDDNGGDKVKFDHNVVLSKKVAFRVVGAWEDTTGQYAYEYKKNFNVTPSLTIIPFESGKVKVNFDFEYLHEHFTYNDYGWLYSDFAGWKDAATNGTYGTSTATLSNTVAANVGNNNLVNANNPLGGNIVQATTTPTVAYATYINNKRVATGNLNLPAYTSMKRGAYYTDKSGNFVYDEHFNAAARGEWDDNEVKTATVSMDFTPFEWLSGRGAWVRDVAYYNSMGNGAVTTPYADGMHYNVGTGSTSGYYRETKTALIDLVFKADFFGIKNKVLVGAQKSDWRQLYMGNPTAADVNLAFLPGATNTISNPDYAGTNAAKYAFAGVPVNQVIKDRNGNIKPVRQIYSNWDPGFEINPDIEQFWHDPNRNALDGYRPVLSSFYGNYQGTALDDRLTVLAGYREEKKYERWQDQSNNFPWYIYPNDMPQNQANYPEDVWGNSKAYQGTIPYDQKGRSAMAGASFAVTKDINVYTSWSKTFKFNTGNVGGFFPGPGAGDELSVYQSALTYGEGTHPGSYTYLGTLITSVAQAKAVQVARGAYANLKNETGKNIEFGAKMSTADNKIVGTVSVFRGERSNQKLDDPVMQLAANEPYNYSTTLFAPGSYGYNTRNFRWRTTDLTNRVEGTEAEVIWTPIRNFQAVINGSWLWTAKTLDDKTHPQPGSDRFNALSAAGQRDQIIYYAGRLEYVPEYRFNFFGKYTLTDGVARGASFGLGARYMSQAVVARNVDWNPLAGGYQFGDFTVFDVTVGYPWEVLGFKLQSSLGIYNITNKAYSDGGYVLSPSRNWLFSNTVRF